MIFYAIICADYERILRLILQFIHTAVTIYTHLCSILQSQGTGAATGTLYMIPPHPNNPMDKAPLYSASTEGLFLFPQVFIEMPRKVRCRAACNATQNPRVCNKTKIICKTGFLFLSFYVILYIDVFMRRVCRVLCLPPCRLPAFLRGAAALRTNLPAFFACCVLALPAFLRGVVALRTNVPAFLPAARSRRLPILPPHHPRTNERITLLCATKCFKN